MCNYVIAIAALLVSSCSTVAPSPDPTPVPGPGGGIYEEACANLAAQGCSEGLDATCAATMRSAQEKKLTDLRPECLAQAASAADVRACGTVECLVEVGKAVPATCANACAVVKKLGCPEAGGCLGTCSKVVGAKLVDLKLSCLVKATTKADLRACGSIECKP
jgi:hypothetical protein